MFFVSISYRTLYSKTLTLIITAHWFVFVKPDKYVLVCPSNVTFIPFHWTIKPKIDKSFLLLFVLKYWSPYYLRWLSISNFYNKMRNEFTCDGFLLLPCVDVFCMKIFALSSKTIMLQLFSSRYKMIFWGKCVCLSLLNTSMWVESERASVTDKGASKLRLRACLSNLI